MSYTSLAELERCGYRYYTERVLRLPENRAAARSGEDDGTVEARVRGTVVHALLESVDFAHPRVPTVDEVERVARRLGVAVGVRAREEIAALTADALRSAPAGRLAVANHARTEHAFAFSLGPEQPLVTGVLDLIVREPDGTSLIVDYKSDRLQGGEDLERLVQHDYGLQRMIYALAAIEDGASEVEIAHWFLERPMEWVAARFGADEREELRAGLLARVSRVRAMGFAVTEQPHREICLTCPARGALCSWGETRTMGARLATLESSR
jgi:hypothetical protein